MQQFNPKLVPIKGLYFLYYAGLASFMPYKSIFQKQLGMSSGQNGVIQALMQLVSLFSPPVAGYITDKTKAYKLMMTVCMFFSIVFTIPFYFVPPVERDIWQTEIMCCNGIKNGQFDCIANANITDYTKCKYNDSLVGVSTTSNNTSCVDSSIVLTCEFADTDDVYDLTFGSLVLLTCLMSFFLAPVTPLVDSSAMDTLGVENVKYFGVQRLWGAVAFGIVGLGVSYFTDVISPEDIYGTATKNYLLAVISAGVFWGFAIILIVTSVNIAAPKAKAVLRGVGKLLIKPKVLAFLFVVLVSGFSTGVQYAFVFWYLQELNGYKQYILGLSLLITCISEIPMFWFSGWICKKLGYVTVLVLGLLAVSIRFFTYTIITEAWQVLLVEWLHGISFALPNAAICSYAAVIAPKDAIATLISISMTVYWGLGNMLGALLGGIFYESFGGVQTFRICCGICFITAILYEVIFGHGNLISYCERAKPDAETKIIKVDDTKEAASPEEEQLHPEINGA